MMENNEICKVISSDINAYCTHCVLNPYDGIVYFIAIAGFQVAVKAIVAKFIQRSMVWIKKNDNKTYELYKGYFNYTFQHKKLPSGLFQSIIYPKYIVEQQNKDEISDKSCFFIKISNEITEESDVANLFLSYYMQNTELPLDSSWAVPLWNIFKHDDDFLSPLDTIIGDVHGYIVRFNDGRLNEIITDKIHANSTEFIQCFKRKTNIT